MLDEYIMNKQKICKEYQQDFIETKRKMMIKCVPTTVIKLEKYKIDKFERIMEQNLMEFKNYYRQMIALYHQGFENQLEDIKKKHDEKYQSLNKSLTAKYKEDLTLTKLKYRRLLSSNRPPLPLALPVVDDDVINRKKVESLIRQKIEKLNDLNQKCDDLMFFKTEIKRVLNNYNRVLAKTHTQISGVDYELVKKKIFEKYLGPITMDELKQLLNSEDEYS